MKAVTHKYFSTTSMWLKTLGVRLLFARQLSYSVMGIIKEHNLSGIVTNNNNYMAVASLIRSRKKVKELTSETDSNFLPS